MTNLTNKIGFNCFHDDYTGRKPWASKNLKRALDFATQCGAKYLRPAFALQNAEFNSTSDGDGMWRVAPLKEIISSGITPILNLYPQQLKDHLSDSDADELVSKAVQAYQRMIKVLLDNGISSNDFIIEAWNEADGHFAASGFSAKNDLAIINRYLEFNKRMCVWCKRNGIRFIDLDSVCYPYAPELSTVMDTYNQKMTEYEFYPDSISFHPYCERGRGDNTLPEQLLTTYNLDSWNNLSQFKLSATEFGYPSVEWANSFSGKYPFQYARDLMIRQILILDYLKVNPIVIYSANTNADQSYGDTDDVWGAYQYDADEDAIKMTDLGRVVLRFMQTMQGYYLSDATIPDDIRFGNYVFEYTNDNLNRKKIYFWNPLGQSIKEINWNGNLHNLNFNQHVRTLEEAF